MEIVNTMLHDTFLKLGPEDTQLLQSEQGMIYGMSRKRSCVDNAVIENFFGTLKSVCFKMNELRKSIEDYIHYHNNERISLMLKGLSSVEYRIQAQKSALYELSNIMESVHIGLLLD